MTVLGKASQLISTERKDKLKPALNEDIRSLRDNDHTTSDYLFGENISESLKLTKENHKLAQNLANSKSTQGINHWDPHTEQATSVDMMQKPPPVIPPVQGLL